MKNKRIALKEKGITLVALVVTIIVLLILAGVTIQMVIGQKGIIGKAADSKQVHEEAQIREKINLAYQSAIVDGQGNITESLLEQALKEEFNKESLGDNWLDKESIENKWRVTIDGVYLDLPAGNISQSETTPTDSSIIDIRSGYILRKSGKLSCYTNPEVTNGEIVEIDENNLNEQEIATNVKALFYNNIFITNDNNLYHQNLDNLIAEEIKYISRVNFDNYYFVDKNDNLCMFSAWDGYDVIDNNIDKVLSKSQDTYLVYTKKDGTLKLYSDSELADPWIYSPNGINNLENIEYFYSDAVGIDSLGNVLNLINSQEYPKNIRIIPYHYNATVSPIEADLVSFHVDSNSSRDWNLALDDRGKIYILKNGSCINLYEDSDSPFYQKNIKKISCRSYDLFRYTVGFIDENDRGYYLDMSMESGSPVYNNYYCVSDSCGTIRDISVDPIQSYNRMTKAIFITTNGELRTLGESYTVGGTNADEERFISTVMAGSHTYDDFNPANIAVSKSNYKNYINSSEIFYYSPNNKGAYFEEENNRAYDTFESNNTLYSLSFIKDNGKWYYSTLEDSGMAE